MNLFHFWNELKQYLEKDTTDLFFKERDIFFAYCGKNLGFEQDGKGERFLRPVVVIKKFNNELFWGVFLTSQKRSGKYYYSFLLNEKRENTAILSQFKLLDRKRLKHKIGVMKQEDFAEVKKILSNILLED